MNENRIDKIDDKLLFKGQFTLLIVQTVTVLKVSEFDEIIGRCWCYTLINYEVTIWPWSHR